MKVYSYSRLECVIGCRCETSNAAWLMPVLYELQLKEVNTRFRRDAADTVRDATSAIDNKEYIPQTFPIKIFNSIELTMPTKFTRVF